MGLIVYQFAQLAPHGPRFYTRSMQVGERPHRAIQPAPCYLSPSGALRGTCCPSISPWLELSMSRWLCALRTGICVLLITAGRVTAADGLSDSPQLVAPTEAISPAEQLKKFHLTAGLLDPTGRGGARHSQADEPELRRAWPAVRHAV